MEDKNLKIGIALSGGGVRAAVFHLGVLKWIAENDMLQNIVRISSVSGASLAIGLIYSLNNYKWPTKEEYLNSVLPEIKKKMTSIDIEKKAIKELLLSQKHFNKRVNALARAIKKYWNICGTMDQVDNIPSWYVNCTTFETGKRFRFSQKNMGDYKIGYVNKPNIAIADIIAASAGFPLFIGPYELKLSNFDWEKSRYEKELNLNQTNTDSIHLWDGGVYDNLGLESIYDMNNGGSLKEDINYIIVSNASSNIGFLNRKHSYSTKNLKRLLDIAMDQVGALRNRSVMNYIKNTKNGIYLKIGNTAEYITEESKSNKQLKDELLKECMDKRSAEEVKNYPTRLKRLEKSKFDLILAHGYEVAKCTYLCYENEH